MLQDFKNFILRGNVVDLAVGVIIGVAFGKIVDSVVGDIFMPIIGARKPDAAEPASPSRTETLLEEIRDAIRSR